MAMTEKILEGKFLYYQEAKQYSEEIFFVEEETSLDGHLYFNSEILSRVSTGEFLKLNVRYELTKRFEPVDLIVKRLLGKNASTEHYRVDPRSKLVSYRFEGLGGVYNYEKPINKKFTIASPAFCTSALPSLTVPKQTIEKTSCTIVNSPNIWEYKNHFSESVIFIESALENNVELTINKNILNAKICHFTEEETSKNPNPLPAIFYLSKHFNIPYKAEFPQNIEVIADTFKVIEKIDYKGMF